MLYSFTYIYSSYIGYLGYKMHIHIFCRNLKYLAEYIEMTKNVLKYLLKMAPSQTCTDS